MKTRRRLCASCLDFNFNKTLKSSKKHKPKWLNKIDYVEQFINKTKNFSINYPEKFDNVLNIDVGKKYVNRKILYWAAKPSNNILINDAKSAYGNFFNSGVAKIDNKGFAKVKFLTPQNYKTINKNEKNNTTFFKHIHFVISNNNNDDWINIIYTKLVHNNNNYNNFMKKLNSNLYIVLNVLPEEMYATDHIPNTYNLPYNKIKKMTIKELNNWLQNLIDLHYPKINKLLKSKKLEYYELPLICCCAHNKCDASKTGSINLMKKGFINVNLFEDGLKGYKENKKQN